MRQTRTWVFVGREANPDHNRMVTTYTELRHAVTAYDPFVEAWLDGNDLTLAQASRTLASEGKYAMRQFPNVPAAIPYWHDSWMAMWRSIGHACERSTWDTARMWSRPMGAL